MRFLNLRITIVLIVLGIIGTLKARGGAERPDWTAHIPQESAGNRFYVGRSSNASSEAEGFNLATRDALEHAILENFGFQTRVERESFEAMDKISALKRAEEVSRKIEIHGFEQVDSYKEGSGTGISVWVLYRYSAAAIAREKARLAQARDSDAMPAFSEIGSPSVQRGTLEVVSRPPGAQVFIDGEDAGLLTTQNRSPFLRARGRRSDPGTRRNSSRKPSASSFYRKAPCRNHSIQR
jgi:hypothetical protein